MIAIATADVLQALAYDDLFEAATLCGLLAMGTRRGGGGSLVETDRLTSERSAACIHTCYRSDVHRS